MRNIAALASCFVLGAAPAASIAQDRGGRGAEKAAPTHVVRIVTADGDQTLATDLVFRWTDFVTPGAAAAPGGRGGGRGEGGGGGGRGEGGGRGNAFQRAAGAFSTFYGAVGSDRSRDLGRVDRIEFDGDLVVQAKPPERAFPRVQGTAYSGGYGGLAFDVPAGWAFADATDVSALALKRASDGEIVGRMRLRIHQFGDGKSPRVTFDESTVEAEKLIGPAFVERFEKIGGELKEDPIQDDGTRVKRLGRKGVEKGTGVPLHLEGNLVLDGPFVPVLEILARGDDADAILAEARKALASVRFDRTQAAPEHDAEAPAGDTAPPVAPPDDGGRGGRGAGGGGRDPMAAVQGLLGQIQPLEQSDFVKDGIYANPKLGVRAKDPLPKGFFFTRADAFGFTAFMKGEDQTVLDLATVSVTVLWGDLVVKNKMQWLTERYVDGFLGPMDDGEKPPKARPSTLGKMRGSHLEMERSLPFAGESTCDVWFIEDKGRMVMFLASAVGSSGDRDKNLKAIERWLKTVELVRPDP